MLFIVLLLKAVSGKLCFAVSVFFKNDKEKKQDNVQLFNFGIVHGWNNRW